MRFAGTWKQYSKKAIPQLTMITFQSASLRNFRWPYHAKVMKMFETVSNRIVRIRKAAPRKVLCYKLETRKASPKLQFRQTLSAGFHTTILPFPFLLSIPSANLREYALTRFCSLLAEFDKNFRKIERIVCLRDRTSPLRFFLHGHGNSGERPEHSCRFGRFRWRGCADSGGPAPRGRPADP